MDAAPTRPTTVPKHAPAGVDARAWTTAELERVGREIRQLTPRLPGATVEVSGGINRHPLEESAATTLLALAQDAAADIRLAPPDGPPSPGRSDANPPAALGVPTLAGRAPVGAHPH